MFIVEENSDGELRGMLNEDQKLRSRNSADKICVCEDGNYMVAN